MNQNERDQNRLSQQTGFTFERLAVSLANDYESIYVINTEDDSYVEYVTGGPEKMLRMHSSGKDFYADTRINCRKLVYPEDQENFLAAFHKENVYAALENPGSFTLHYRLVIDGKPQYYFLKTIRGSGMDDRYIMIGVQNINEQRQRELKIAEESRIYSEIANSLAGMFEVIYHIDVKKSTYRAYCLSEKYSRLNLNTEGDFFWDKLKADIPTVVHPEDISLVEHELDRDTLLRHLQENGTISIKYRQFFEGQTRYVKLFAMQPTNDADHIVIGVRDIDAQTRRRQKEEAEHMAYSHIAGALASRYEVIYYIDIETNAYTTYRTSEQYAQLGTATQGKDFFIDADKDIRQYIHPDDAARILHELDRERLLRHLDQTGSVSLTYRQSLGTEMHYVTMLAVRPKNDHSRIVIGVLDIDVQVRREQKIAAQNATFSEIAEALAKRYEVIYHVNLQTNEYTEYSASEKYRNLSIGAKGEDFFADSQRNMKRDIYPEDYPMMAKSMEKEFLLRSLQDTGTTALNYRLILDNRPQYVTLFVIRPKEDSNHIIVAVANVDAAKRRELEFRDALGNAMDLANRDALTGVKSKHAYVQVEMEMDALIGAQRNPPFALVVCDINGLKHVNDTQGHSAGDAYIRSACNIICQTFKHSPVFRIGGDEFTIILKGDDYMNRETLSRCFTAIQEDQQANGLVTVAFGISCFDAQKDMRLQDVFERADSAMYDNKKQTRSRI